MEFTEHTLSKTLSVPPLAPRWKGAPSREAVRQLNERCVEVLCEAATEDFPATTLPVITEHRTLWRTLPLEARRLVAQIPFAIVDAQFGNEASWQQLVQDRAGFAVHATGLPGDVRHELMHETLMFAWQIARWDREVALMAFGMRPAVADLILALTPRQLRTIAATEHGGIQVRWADDLAFWRELLLAARAGNDEKLAELHLQAKLLLCSELAKIKS